MSETARIQYVFLDVVGFTRGRSVEAQSEIVAALNTIVSASIQACTVSKAATILIPTGDGMAVAIINQPPVDVHLQVALRILSAVSIHNGGQSDPMRQFEVRIGINENIDNLVTDINGQRNVAGAGISMAQRIMDNADASQVLVGATVYETLRQREAYMTTWRAFNARGKHDITFPVYQFLSKSAVGLNVSPPSAFVVRRREPERLTDFAAYYLALAITNREFLLSRKSDPTRNYAATVLLAFLAEDLVEASHTPSHQEATIITWRGGMAAFEEQYDHYSEMEFWPIARLSDAIQERELAPFQSLFEHTEDETFYWLVNHTGVDRLLSERPKVAQTFNISKSAG